MRKQLRAESSSRSYVAPWHEKEPDACKFFDIPVYDQAEDAHCRMKEKLLAPFEERAVQRGGTADQGRLIGIVGHYHSEETIIWRFNHIIGRRESRVLPLNWLPGGGVLGVRGQG